MLKQSVWRQDTNIQTSTFTVSFLTNIYGLKSWEILFLSSMGERGIKFGDFMEYLVENQIPSLTAIMEITRSKFKTEVGLII